MGRESQRPLADSTSLDARSSHRRSGRCRLQCGDKYRVRNRSRERQNVHFQDRPRFSAHAPQATSCVDHEAQECTFRHWRLDAHFRFVVRVHDYVGRGVRRRGRHLGSKILLDYVGRCVYWRLDSMARVLGLGERG